MMTHFDQLESTNCYLRQNHQGMPQYAVVTAAYQTAGRGQRGNGWESEPGRNLLFSMLYYPPAGLPPSRQFQISKAVAVAVAETVDRLLDGYDHPEVCIKWPNDIYVGDRKIAGILIENALQSSTRIAHSIIGVGLNVNQREFRSGAPNPVSAVNITGRETPPEVVAGWLRQALVATLPLEDSWLDECYRRRLWRSRGFHPYISLVASAAPAPTAVKVGDDSGRAGCFEAEIVGVDPDGPITLRTRSGELRVFSFKEVAPVL